MNLQHESQLKVSPCEASTMFCACRSRAKRDMYTWIPMAPIAPHIAEKDAFLLYLQMAWFHHAVLVLLLSADAVSCWWLLERQTEA